MPQLQVLSALPTDPDDGLAGNPSPPKVAQLPALDGLVLRLQIAAGIAAVRPYYWAYGKWHGLGADGVSGVGAEPTTVDSTKTNGTAEGRYVGNSEPRWWCLLKESGAGVPTLGALDAVPRGR